ncbi:MAG: hypothetical protein KatS3mg056_3654 [Chloroflexus sp.]|nr:MAG: hypothetical protein KatS3mg056_3654 [Chloroflexus sp.]
MCIAEKLFGVRASRSAEAILPRHPWLVPRAPGVCWTTSRNIIDCPSQNGDRVASG